MAEKVRLLTKKIRYVTIFIFMAFCVLLITIVTALNIKMNAESRTLLESSVKSQLLSICAAAGEMMDMDAFVTYTPGQDYNSNVEYYKTLMRLRALAVNTGAKYIYALREIDGVYYFVFDTDTESDTYFDPYEPSEVHIRAFEGFEVADVMNVADEYGSFNTGAIPLYHAGKVAGIISVDTDDTLMQQNMIDSRINTALLIGSISITLMIMFALFLLLIKRITDMQAELTRMAHYDKLTNLPNRQYLLEYLPKVSRGHEPYALYFIDLDNFKLVNDTAGHDAGDALLRNIGAFLSGMGEDRSRVFRPSAGALNVAARVGGDEFILIAPGIASEAEADEFARNMLESFHTRDIDKYIAKYNVGLSVGAALYPYHSDNFHVLLKYADIAMYHAKNAGKNTFRCYFDEMSDKPGK